jgi:hypothetical protein
MFATDLKSAVILVCLPLFAIIRYNPHHFDETVSRIHVLCDFRIDRDFVETVSGIRSGGGFADADGKIERAQGGDGEAWPV